MAKKPYKGKSHNKTDLLVYLNQIADAADVKAAAKELEKVGKGKGHKKRADGIRALIADLNDGKRDAADVKLKGRIRLQKYTGNPLPEDDPVEVQEFITEA